MDLWIGWTNSLILLCEPKLLCPRHAINQTKLSFQLALPNGRAEESWLIAADGALMGELGLLSSSALFGGLWAQAAPRQLAQRRDERRKKANSARLLFPLLSIWEWRMNDQIEKANGRDEVGMKRKAKTNSIHSIPFSFSRWGCGEEKRNWWNWAAGRGRVAPLLHNQSTKSIK